MAQRLAWTTILLLFGCTLSPDRGERISLDWVETVDARTLFEADRRDGNYRFFSVMGISEIIPALGSVEYEVCFYRHADLDWFDGPGDAIGDSEDARLGGLVVEFAEVYNRLMRDHLRETGRTRCDPAADLDAVWMELSELAGERPNYVAFTGGFLWFSPTFSFRMKQRPEESIRAPACEVLQRNHALGIVDLTIEDDEGSIDLDC